MEFDINGATLHVDTHGDGEPLLWLHGFMGSGSDWKYVFPEPPAGFQVIAPDLRGHGRSTNPSGAFTFRQAALDMLTLVGLLGVRRLRAVGVSGGGITLLHMATMDPSLIDAMVVVSAPPYFPAEARALQRQFAFDTLSEPEQAMMRERHRLGAAQIDQLMMHARGFADSYEDVNFTPPLLSRITADTLIVFGDRDPLYPVSLAFELRESIPRSRLWVIPDGGHSPVFGQAAQAFSATACSFLRGEFR